MSYDLIGDIHGHAETLEALLLKLEYEKRDGSGIAHIATGKVKGKVIVRVQ